MNTSSAVATSYCTCISENLPKVSSAAPLTDYIEIVLCLADFLGQWKWRIRHARLCLSGGDRYKKKNTLFFSRQRFPCLATEYSIA